MTKGASQNSTRNSDFVIPPSFNTSPARTTHHSRLAGGLISHAAGLIELLPLTERNARVAGDTEADSLQCHREERCLLQVNSPDAHAPVDPLAGSGSSPR